MTHTWPFPFLTDAVPLADPEYDLRNLRKARTADDFGYDLYHEHLAQDIAVDRSAVERYVDALCNHLANEEGDW